MDEWPRGPRLQCEMFKMRFFGLVIPDRKYMYILTHHSVTFRSHKIRPSLFANCGFPDQFDRRWRNGEMVRKASVRSR